MPAGVAGGVAQGVGVGGGLAGGGAAHVGGGKQPLRMTTTRSVACSSYGGYLATQGRQHGAGFVGRHRRRSRQAKNTTKYPSSATAAR
jgi:hypothetical protein